MITGYSAMSSPVDISPDCAVLAGWDRRVEDTPVLDAALAVPATA